MKGPVMTKLNTYIARVQSPYTEADLACKARVTLTLREMLYLQTAIHETLNNPEGISNKGLKVYHDLLVKLSIHTGRE